MVLVAGKLFYKRKWYSMLEMSKILNWHCVKNPAQNAASRILSKKPLKRQ